jgi:hypothetical protein
MAPAHAITRREIVMPRIRQGTALCVCLLLFASFAPGVAGSPKAADPNNVGPYAIGHSSLEYEAPVRAWDLEPSNPRRLPVEVFYPVDPRTISPSTPQAVYPLDPINGVWPETVSADWEPYGVDRAYERPSPSARKPFPLLVFSPGLGTPIWCHNFLAARLASHGFVVAVIYHYGDAFFPWERWDGLGVTGANRPFDVSFVLDRLLEQNATLGHPLAGLINPGLIAASGWSYGGYAATALASGVDDVGWDIENNILAELNDMEAPPGSHVPVPRDPRVKAIVPLDGSSWVLQFHELARVSVPAMGLGEEWSMLEQDMGWLEGFVSWQARQHAAFQGHPNYRVDVTDTWHGSFSNMCEGLTLVIEKGFDRIYEPGYEWLPYMIEGNRAWACGAPLPSSEANRVVAKYMVAFLRAHLVGEPGYQSLLTPGAALKNSPKVEFFVTEKRNSSSIDEDWPDYFWYFPHQPGSEQFKAEKNPKGPLPVADMGLRQPR